MQGESVTLIFRKGINMPDCPILLGFGMGKYAHVSARLHLEQRRTDVGPVPLRLGADKIGSNGGGGNSSATKPSRAILSLDKFIADLDGRKYFAPGGAPRDNWDVVYGKTVDEAWDKAFEKDSSISLQVRDYQVTLVKEVIRNIKWPAEMDRARQRTKEAVENMLRGMQNLPPDTKRRAVDDAVLLASLMVLKNSGAVIPDTLYNIMVDIKEIWDSGFGRYTIVNGKHLIYSIRTEEPSEEVVMQEQSS
jgi:hypothetical protein